MNAQTFDPAGYPGTLILDRADIARTMRLADYVDSVEAAFRCHAAGEILVPAVVHIPAAAGVFHVKSAGYAGAHRFQPKQTHLQPNQ